MADLRGFESGEVQRLEQRKGSIGVVSSFHLLTEPFLSLSFLKFSFSIKKSLILFICFY